MWKVSPFPCVGQFKFIIPYIPRQPAYSRIVEVLKAGGRYLDVGLALGQDMRYLVNDGCPSTNMFAIEMLQGFVDGGYDLWRDKETLKTQFIVGDLLDRSLEPAQALLGTVDIIHVGWVLHLFGLEKQKQACLRLCEFLKPAVGSTIVGSSVGRVPPGEWKWPDRDEVMYKHDVQTYRAMWDEISTQAGIAVEVNAWEEDMMSVNGERGHWNDPNTTQLFWEVRRIE